MSRLQVSDQKFKDLLEHDKREHVDATPVRMRYLRALADDFADEMAQDAAMDREPDREADGDDDDA